MKCVIEVPKGRETDFRWYMDQLEAKVLEESDNLVYQVIPDYMIRQELEKYKKAHPAIGNYFKDEDLIKDATEFLQDEANDAPAVEADAMKKRVQEGISLSLEDALADAEQIEHFKKDPNLTPEAVEKARKYLLEDGIHAWDVSYMKSSIFSILEQTENINRIIWKQNKIVYKLATELRSALSDAEKAIFLADPKKPLDESLGNFLLSKDFDPDNLTKAPATAEEQEKAREIVPALRKFSEKMEQILMNLRDGSEKPFRANPLIQYLDAARELKPFLPETVALRTDFSPEEAKTPQEKETYENLQEHMRLLDALRGHKVTDFDPLDYLLDDKEPPALDSIRPDPFTAAYPVITEPMRETYTVDRDNLDYDALNKRVAVKLLDHDADRSVFHDFATLASSFGVPAQNEAERKAAVDQYTEELIRAARAEFAMRAFETIPGVSMGQIETAQKYLFEEHLLPYDAHKTRHALYQSLMALKDTPKANETLSRDWFTETLPACLNRIKEAETQMEKALFLVNPKHQSDEYAGAFLLTNDLHPFHAPVQKEKLIQNAQKAYAKLGSLCDLEDTFHHILEQAEPAPKDATYDPALVQCALLYQDAAKNLADTLGSNSIGMRKIFFVDELPAECREPYQEGEKKLDVLRGRVEPEGKESLAEKTLREIYTRDANVFSYDDLNTRAVAQLQQMGASDKTIKEVAKIAQTINPNIKDTKAYTKQLTEQAKAFTQKKNRA